MLRICVGCSKHHVEVVVASKRLTVLEGPVGLVVELDAVCLKGDLATDIALNI